MAFGKGRFASPEEIDDLLEIRGLGLPDVCPPNMLLIQINHRPMDERTERESKTR